MDHSLDSLNLFDWRAVLAFRRHLIGTFRFDPNEEVAILYGEAWLRRVPAESELSYPVRSCSIQIADGIYAMVENKRRMLYGGNHCKLSSAGHGRACLILIHCDACIVPPREMVMSERYLRTYN